MAIKVNVICSSLKKKEIPMEGTVAITMPTTCELQFQIRIIKQL